MNCLTMRPPIPDQSGFGLLEALVALVLLASVGFALLAWVQQNLDTAQRLRGHYEEQAARKMALELMRPLNPMEKPEGEIKLGTMRFVWKAVQNGLIISQTGYPAGIGKHDLALFDTRISVFRAEESKPWFVEQLTMVGFRRVGARGFPFADG